MSALATVTDRRAWLAWRRGGIGGSDAAAIVGLDPYRGPMSVWLSKTGRLGDDEDEDLEYVMWGNLLEPAIAQQFEKRTGLLVPLSARALMLEHSAHPWMRATIDGLVTEAGADPDGLGPIHGATPLGVVEIKTVAGFKSGAWAESVPEHFQLQCQHQLAVTGLQHAWIAVLFGGQRMEIRELERDDDVIDSLIAVEEGFWTRNVLGDVPPPTDGYATTSEDLRRAFPGGGDEAIVLPDEALGLIRQRTEAKAVIAAGEKSCREAEQALMVMLRDSEVGWLDGKPRVTWKRFERSSVDLDGLRAHDADLVARFTSRTPYRMFRVNGREED